MTESSTFNAILQEGEVKGRILGARQLLLLQGTKKKFGPPDAVTKAKLEAINDLNELDALAIRLLDVSSWEELLDG